MMKLFRTAVIGVMMVTLAACANNEQGQKQTIGNILGGGLGALVGSQIGGGKGKLAGVAIGAIAGAYLGGEFGKSLDKADQAYAERNAQDTLEYNRTKQSSTWNNPDSKASGTFTPTRTFQTAEGNSCREFETTIIVDGKTETATGTACRQPDGSWRVVN